MISFCWKYYQEKKYGTLTPETLHDYSNDAKKILNSGYNNRTCTSQNKLEFLKCYIEICDKLGFRTTKDSLVKEYNTIATQTGTRSYPAVSAPANAASANTQNSAQNVVTQTANRINRNKITTEEPHNKKRDSIDEAIDAVNAIY